MVLNFMFCFTMFSDSFSRKTLTHIPVLNNLKTFLTSTSKERTIDFVSLPYLNTLRNYFMMKNSFQFACAKNNFKHKQKKAKKNKTKRIIK